MFGNKGRYNDVLNKWCPEDEPVLSEKWIGYDAYLSVMGTLIEEAERTGKHIPDDLIEKMHNANRDASLLDIAELEKALGVDLTPLVLVPKQSSSKHGGC